MRGLPVLRGEGVVLRPLELERERAQAHHRWRNDRDIMRWHYIRPRTSYRDERERLRRLLDSPDDRGWDVFTEAPGAEPAHVGYLVLRVASRDHAHAEVSITIGERAAWGRGIGRKALSLVLDHAFSEAERLHKVFLNVAAANERAVRCYRSLGFVLEGRKREHLRIDGAWVDDLCMSILDREWLAGAGAKRGDP
jgi:RimJ/RimL family protein N-acetyltransferase